MDLFSLIVFSLRNVLNVSFVLASVCLAFFYFIHKTGLMKFFKVFVKVFKQAQTLPLPYIYTYPYLSVVNVK